MARYKNNYKNKFCSSFTGTDVKRFLKLISLCTNSKENFIEVIRGLIRMPGLCILESSYRTDTLGFTILFEVIGTRAFGFIGVWSSILE